MTSKKQITANQANSKKSTGAKTEQGKSVVSINAVKHGIFSSRLIMSFESAEEYGQLLNGLIESLNPSGSVEQLLVEKIAVAMWRQLRLTRAESASIEINRDIHNSQIRGKVHNLTSAGGDDLFSSLSVSDFAPATEQQLTQVKWCKKVLKEFSDILEDDQLNDVDLIRKAPAIMGQLESETKEDECPTVQEYVDTLSDDLESWTRELADWCEKEVNKIEHKEMARLAMGEALAIVQAKESAPFKNELLIRYQVALDGELYKALEALRKQQEWRLKSSDLIEAVAV